MTSHYAALNRNLERLKLSVQMRKQQRSNWMQRLMRDTASSSANTADSGREACDQLVNSTLELVPVYSAETNPASLAPSSESEQGQTSVGMLPIASKQAGKNNTTRLH